MENRSKMGGESGPRSSTKSCTHTLDRICVESWLVLLSEAWACVDEG